MNTKTSKQISKAQSELCKAYSKHLDNMIRPRDVLITEVIESKRWKNKTTGHMVSIFGSVPWVNDADRDNWVMVSVGWTWRHRDGSIGLGKTPAKTRDDAIKEMDRINHEYSQRCHEYDSAMSKAKNEGDR